MTNLKPIAVGLIGAGFHAREVHIPAIDLVPELRLVAIATSREETARAAAERYRVNGYADYRELLDRDDVEAVIIATSTNTHEVIARDALQRGKHVLIETPGIPNLVAARELRELARTKKLVAQVAFLTRYSQSFDVLKSHLDAQVPPRLFCYEYFPFLTHTYNLALYFSGPLDHVVSATADAAGSSAMLRFRNGDTAVVIGRSLANCSVNIERVTASTKGFYASVEGRTQVRIIENMKPTGVDAWGAASSGGILHDPQPFAGRFHENTGAAPQLRGFASAIREDKPPRSTLEDMIETLAMMEQIEAATGKSA